MKRALSAAIFSAAFCAVNATLYFTAHIAIEARMGLSDFALALPTVAVFALPIAGGCGFAFGFIGGLILPRFPFAKTKARFAVVSAVLGGIVACTLPAIPHIFPPDRPQYGEILGFAPCIVIGVLCATLWALVWFPNDPLMKSPR
jgi:hypothetical protein